MRHWAIIVVLSIFGVGCGGPLAGPGVDPAAKARALDKDPIELLAHGPALLQHLGLEALVDRVPADIRSPMAQVSRPSLAKPFGEQAQRTMAAIAAVDEPTLEVIAQHAALEGGLCDDSVADAQQTGATCRDINPALWHIVVTNSIGVAGRPLGVIKPGATSDIVNTARIAVDYSIIHQSKTPNEVCQSTDESIALVRAALCDAGHYAHNDNVESLLAVAMQVDVVDPLAQPLPAQAATAPQPETLNYQYVLELDADGKILGGEWLDSAFPDALWWPREVLYPQQPPPDLPYAPDPSSGGPL